MKKSRITKLAAALFLAGMMAFAFAGCGDTQEPEEPTEAVTETETAEETAADFDIMTVLNENGFEEEFSADIMYEVEQDSETSVSVYLKSAKVDGDGGLAGTIMAFEEGNTEYEQFPDYEVIGQKDGMTYITMYATDVQFGEDADQQTIDNYNGLVQKLKEFKVE